MSPAAATASLPTRSEIDEWSTSRLSDAAASWRSAAAASEAAFDEHRQNIASAGGTTWEGDAKDAALDRATKDIVVVGQQGDGLREAADLAENGAHDIRETRNTSTSSQTYGENPVAARRILRRWSRSQAIYGAAGQRFPSAVVPRATQRIVARVDRSTGHVRYRKARRRRTVCD
ncbi:Uncharacterised protein [Mycobacteroides abscessus subsp. bolletii]|nr:Uncharacterised protein [Mycobacteroides abscessus subsp. bolletii]